MFSFRFKSINIYFLRWLFIFSMNIQHIHEYSWYSEGQIPTCTWTLNDMQCYAIICLLWKSSIYACAWEKFEKIVVTMTQLYQTFPIISNISNYIDHASKIPIISYISKYMEHVPIISYISNYINQLYPIISEYVWNTKFNLEWKLYPIMTIFFITIISNYYNYIKLLQLYPSISSSAYNWL